MHSIISQISFFAFFQGLFLIVIFMISASKRKKINVYLLILISVLMLGLIGNIGQETLGWNRQLKGMSEFSVLLFGPTIYLFIQSIMSEKRFLKKDLIHYIPAVLYNVIIIFYYMTPAEEVIKARIESGELFRVVHILIGTGLVVNITYYILSIIKFRELSNALQAEVSYILNINFVRNFLVVIGLCFFIWTIIYLISFGNDPWLEINSRELIWMAVALIVLFIAYYQMVTPVVFHFDKKSKETKYAQSRYSKVDLDNLKLELEKIMEDRKPYLNSKLLKSELAEMMSINAPELSRLLNERIGMSFFEYINYHRIHEFIRLAKSPLIEQKTLLGLAQESGFQSKSTFNKAFKRIMGCSPSVYLKESN